LKLGCQISCIDPRTDRRKEFTDTIESYKVFSSIEKALESQSFDGTVISSPPVFHEEQAILALKAGTSVLLEKPIGLTMSKMGALRCALEEAYRANNVNLLLGYTWRWWEALKYVRRLVRREPIGNFYHARIFVSAHLADWHPWERYQDFFMAKKEQGGGALLDESHWIDQMIWLFGMPDAIVASVDKVSDLDITSDDSVDILAVYESGLKVSIHLDIYGRPHEKSILLLGRDGSLHWEEKTNCVSLTEGKSEIPETLQFINERNDMFMGVAQEYLSVLGGLEPITCTLSSGLDVMRVIEAARLSQLENRLVVMEEIDS
jgi:predicted dehydrogenase